MKTQIITIFTALVLTAGIAKANNVAPVKDQTAVVLTGISAINKIEVHGNVELYVSDGNTDQVKVYNKYYSESALVQSKNGVLRITSYNAEKLVVWVTANDLREISAFDNAAVSSFGKLSKIELTVDLHNNAVAKLDIDAFTANLTVADQAKANVTGAANDFDLKYANADNVNQKELVTVNATKTLTTMVKITKTELDELANL